MSESFTLYKLIILYMLRKVDFSLTNGQITSFLLERGYTSYFVLQQAIAEMIDSNLIKTETIRNTSYYQMTREGEDTLDFFGKNISHAIKNDIDEYLRENKYTLRNEVSVLADYYKTTQQEYEVRCTVKERHSNLIDLRLTVDTEVQAARIADNWRKKNQDIYAYLMEELLQ